VPSCSELGEGHVDIDVLDQERGNTETSRSARKADTNRPSASVCREQAKLVGCGKAPLAGMEHYRRSRTHNSRRAWVLAAKHSHDIHR
jgi:hypothetical protein